MVYFVIGRPWLLPWRPAMVRFSLANPSYCHGDLQLTIIFLLAGRDYCPSDLHRSSISSAGPGYCHGDFAMIDLFSWLALYCHGDLQ